MFPYSANHGNSQSLGLRYQQINLLRWSRYQYQFCFNGKLTGGVPDRSYSMIIVSEDESILLGLESWRRCNALVLTLVGRRGVYYIVSVFFPDSSITPSPVELIWVYPSLHELG